MPGEVAEQPLRLVAGAEGERLVLGREIEQHDHALARHDVAFARSIGVACLPQVPVHRIADIHGDGGDPELIDHQLRVLHALRARRAIRHTRADHVLPAERLGGEERRERRIHAARQADDPLLEPAPHGHLVLEERDEPAASQVDINRQRVALLHTPPHHVNR